MSSLPFIAATSSIRFNSISQLLMLVWVLSAVAMCALAGMYLGCCCPPCVCLGRHCVPPPLSLFAQPYPVWLALSDLCLLLGDISTNVSGWLLHFTRLGVLLKTALLRGPPARIPALLVMIVVFRLVFNVLCSLRANKLVQFSSVQFSRHRRDVWNQ